MLPNVNATVIDAMFFLHLQKTIPGTFGALSSYLLTRIRAVEKGNELHMVFDKVQSPSIKDCERDERPKMLVESGTIRSLVLGNTHHVTGYKPYEMIILKYL